MEDGVRRGEIERVRPPPRIEPWRIYNRIGPIPMGADPNQWW